jgi:HEAT repeat protein
VTAASEPRTATGCERNINDPNENVRWAALHALMDLADCNSAEVLTHALDDSSESNRALAVLMLERVNLGKMCAGVNDAQ